LHFLYFWKIEMRQAKKAFLARLSWLILPAFAVAGLVVVNPLSAAALTKKTTPTVTSTSTSTPTITPTESLNVFETPATPTVNPQLIYITNPAVDAIVTGSVKITGKTDVQGFARQEVAFSYVTNPTETWFLLMQSSQPVKDDVLATWETGSITDGDYILRLRVYFLDGSWRDTLVNDVQVRNYTGLQAPLPTNTQPVAPTVQPTSINAPVSSPTSIPLPTPSPFPGNNAELPTSQIWISLGRGAAVAVVLFLIFGFLLRGRKRDL
jgi:hypothetical protein